MKSFKEYVTLNEKASVKKGSDLKVGDVILYGREDTPHEVTSKPKQDGTGYWVEVLNLSNKKKDKIYVDSGDTVTMNEKDLEDEVELDESSKATFVSLNKGREGKTAISEKGVELEDSVYLGFGRMAIPDGGNVSIEGYLTSSGKYEQFDLTKQAIKFLAKI